MRHPGNRSMILYRMTLWLFAACFALLLSFSFKSLETFASFDASIPVTSIDHLYGNCLVLLKKGDSLQDFLAANPDYAKVLAYTSAGSRPIVMSVNFYTTSLEQAPAGLLRIPGVVNPTEGYSISHELSSVSLAVWIYDPQNPQILPIENYSDEALPRPLSQVYTTESTMEQLHSDLMNNCGTQIQCRLEGGYILDLPLSWDLSGINMQQPGVYEAPGTPLLPEGLLLPTSLAPFSCSVVVQDPGSFILSPLTRYRSFPAFLWQKDVTPTAENLTLWYSTGDGNWLADTEQEYFVFLNPGLLALDPTAFLSDTSYYLQIGYEEIFSNIMEVRFTDSDLICNDIGGDRDGVDRLPQEIPEPSPDKPVDEETADEGATSEDATSEDAINEETINEEITNEEITNEEVTDVEVTDVEVTDVDPNDGTTESGKSDDKVQDTTLPDTVVSESSPIAEVPGSDASSTEPDPMTEQTEAAPAPENASSPLWLILPAGSATLLGVILFLHVRRKQLW